MCEHNFLSKSWEALIGYCLTYNNKIKAPSAKEVSSLKVIIPFGVAVREEQCKLIVNIKKHIDVVSMQVFLNKIGAHLMGKLTICVDNAGSLQKLAL